MSSGFTKKYGGDPFKVTDRRNPMEVNLERVSDRLPENVGYFVDYYRVLRDSGNICEDRFGTPTLRSYDNGLVGSIECEKCFSLEDAKAVVENKRKVVNNWYCGFGIRKTEYKNGKYETVVLKPCEKVNSVFTENLEGGFKS